MAKTTALVAMLISSDDASERSKGSINRPVNITLSSRPSPTFFTPWPVGGEGILSPPLCAAVRHQLWLLRQQGLTDEIHNLYHTKKYCSRDNLKNNYWISLFFISRYP